MASNNRSACSCILHHDFRTRHGKGCFGCEQSDAGEANKCYGGARRCNLREPRFRHGRRRAHQCMLDSHLRAGLQAPRRASEQQHTPPLVTHPPGAKRAADGYAEH
eukprot:1152880-Pelagomonas_calceolata.AAC.8